MIDAVAPTSSIDPVNSITPSAFLLTWTGNDDTGGSGVKNYDLYVSKKGGPFVLEQTSIDSNSHYFVGEPGSTYNFYTRATDNTGNWEPDKPGGDKIVTIVIPANTICPGGDTYFALPQPGTGYSYQWQIDSTGTGFVDLVSNSIHSGVNTDTLLLHSPPTRYYGYKYRCIASKTGSSVYGSAFILKFLVTWEGTSGSAWENPANWSCNYVPDQYTDAIVPGAMTNNPVISNNTSCRSLLLSSGTMLTINSGVKLDIKGK